MIMSARRTQSHSHTQIECTMNTENVRCKYGRINVMLDTKSIFDIIMIGLVPIGPVSIGLVLKYVVKLGRIYLVGLDWQSARILLPSPPRPNI